MLSLLDKLMDRIKSAARRRRWTWLVYAAVMLVVFGAILVCVHVWQGMSVTILGVGHSFRHIVGTGRACLKEDNIEWSR